MIMKDLNQSIDDLLGIRRRLEQSIQIGENVESTLVDFQDQIETIKVETVKIIFELNNCPINTRRRFG